MGVDDALAQAAENARKLAKENGYGLVDFHEGMNRVIREQQARDPLFTMMDAGRIHPDGAGHLLMAYLFLKSQEISPVVSLVEIDGGKLVASDNCKVTGLEKREKGVAFVGEAGALPYPVEEKEKVVLDWVPFMSDLNQEMLVVRGLAAGEYELLIDGASVARGRRGNWGRGSTSLEIQRRRSTGRPRRSWS